MAQQLYPTYNPQRAAAVEALLAKGRRADSLRRLPPVKPPREYPVYRNTQPQTLPSYNPERTPEGDDRLTGEGGAELASRQIYPTYNAAAAQAEEPQIYPTYNAQA